MDLKELYAQYGEAMIHQEIFANKAMEFKNRIAQHMQRLTSEAEKKLIAKKNDELAKGQQPNSDNPGDK